MEKRELHIGLCCESENEGDQYQDQNVDKIIILKWI
jgi:hypothetical protein